MPKREFCESLAAVVCLICDGVLLSSIEDATVISSTQAAPLVRRRQPEALANLERELFQRRNAPAARLRGGAPLLIPALQPLYRRRFSLPFSSWRWTAAKARSSASVMPSSEAVKYSVGANISPFPHFFGWPAKPHRFVLAWTEAIRHGSIREAWHRIGRGDEKLR